MPESKTILLVDDEDFFRERLARAFVRRGYTVLQADGYDQALDLIRNSKPDRAVVDLRMPGRSGLEVIRDWLAVHNSLDIVVLTGYGSIATSTDAIRLGAVSYLPKPADVEDILNAFTRDPGHGDDVPARTFKPPTLARTEWEHINRVLTDHPLPQRAG
jgi:two-component system response regulator RegA